MSERLARSQLVLRFSTPRHAAVLARRAHGVMHPWMYNPVVDNSVSRFCACVDWEVGEWQPCSRACGGGNQARTVLCISSLSQPAANIADCFRPKPISDQPCNTSPCRTYHCLWCAA